MTRSVSLVVAVRDDMELPRAMEVLARHLSGLILEGHDAWIQVETVEDEAEEEAERE